MDVNSISTLTLPKAGNLVAATQAKMAASAAAKAASPAVMQTPVSQTVQPVQAQETKETAKQENSKNPVKSFKKALPYVAGAIVLAGLGYYALRGKGNKVNKKTVNEVVEEATNTAKKAQDETIAAAKAANTANKAETTAQKAEEKAAAKAEEKAAEAAAKTETPKSDAPKADTQKAESPKPETVKAEDKPAENTAQQAAKAEKKAAEAINLENKEVVEKINKNKKADEAEINRIISDNTKDGHVNFDIMRKVANDFVADEAGRGPDRYHRAADVLEKSYIKEFIKSDGKTQSGLNTLLEKMMADEKLLSIYKKLPLEESACRLDALRKNELANCKTANEITIDEFFEKALAKVKELKS